MLKLSNIVKTYQAADLKVTALKGVSICFRKNEFVSILGPSGCGKTTLLNIIGGLDHYDEGDLVINGRSTHQYSERDWDVYRNHRVGFVFQSYNLIPQSTILENVELSLTIAGLKKEERIERAKAALAKVGLEGLEKKLPNQLSGGQCQRVAIARALVNEPEILLADEPTGALDSVTSVQIMDLIKEISSERLVIMVTHNPDLAKQYSTRIINLKDGLVIDDSAPFSEEDEAKENENITANPNEKAKMSWWTAFKLSAKNLATKAKRTALTVVAASIGIVGVSAVLAVSNGVEEYIVSIQDDLLSGNPVYVASSSIDLTSLMNTFSTLGQGQKVLNGVHDGKIDVDFIVEDLMNLANSTISNDLTDDYLRYLEQMPESYYAAMLKRYGVDLTNNLYTNTKVNTGGDGAEKDVVFSLRGMTGYCETILSHADTGQFASYASLVSSLTSVLRQSLDNEEYILSQYDIVDEGGRFPTAENELMLVLNSEQETTDLLMTMLGYYSQNDFETDMDYHVAKRDKAITPEIQAKYDAIKSVDISRIKEKTFTYYKNDVIYEKLAVDADPTTYTRPFEYYAEAKPEWEHSLDLKITGVLAPKKGTQYGSLRAGLYYTPAFVRRVIADSMTSQIVSFLPKYTAIITAAGTENVKGYICVPSSKMGVLYSLDWYFREQYGKVTLGVGTSTGIGGIAMLSRTALGGNPKPSEVDIYPKSFDHKDLVTSYLDEWNSDKPIVLKATDTLPEKTLSREDRSDVKYNDNLAVIINIINSIIRIITVALIAFTSLALVVSTVMIAIITYVSVMERIKEIGVIRALGGRKKDVSHLFNAETFIIGGISGIFGLSVTYLLQGILNFIMASLFDISTIANLTFWVAGVILLIAIGLTMIAGLIPARSAAKKDPVVALRTE